MINFESLQSNRLDPNFYSQPTLDIARQLIGKYFVVKRDNKLYVVQITETEAYIGEDDAASHARFGRTKRNQIMYGPPGHLYIYLIYGMYYLMNISTEPTDSPAAVLIRGGVLLDLLSNTPFNFSIVRAGLDLPIQKNLNGPGRFTRALGITTSDLGLDLTTSQEIFIVDSGLHPEIITAPRIGINYASEPWRSIPWRFVDINYL